MGFFEFLRRYVLGLLGFHLFISYLNGHVSDDWHPEVGMRLEAERQDRSQNEKYGHHRYDLEGKRRRRDVNGMVK